MLTRCRGFDDDRFANATDFQLKVPDGQALARAEHDVLAFEGAETLQRQRTVNLPGKKIGDLEIPFAVADGIARLGCRFSDHGYGGTGDDLPLVSVMVPEMVPVTV